jgi:hypothetical protein
MVEPCRIELQTFALRMLLVYISNLRLIHWFLFQFQRSDFSYYSLIILTVIDFYPYRSLSSRPTHNRCEEYKADRMQPAGSRKSSIEVQYENETDLGSLLVH